MGTGAQVFPTSSEQWQDVAVSGKPHSVWGGAPMRKGPALCLTCQ